MIKSIIAILIFIITTVGIQEATDNIYVLHYGDRFIITTAGKIRTLSMDTLGYGCLVSDHDPINKYLPPQNEFTTLTMVADKIAQNIKPAVDEEKSLCEGKQYWVIRDRGDQYPDNPVYALQSDGSRKIVVNARVGKGTRCEGLPFGSETNTQQWMSFDGGKVGYVSLCEKVK